MTTDSQNETAQRVGTVAPLFGGFPPYANSNEPTPRPLWDADDMRDYAQQYARECLVRYAENMHELCCAIEALPACEQQTNVSLRAASLRRKMQEGSK
jgi:hypothetical protein